MTFIKLDTDNFVDNTLKSTVESFFDRSDKRTWLSVSEDYSERVFKGQSLFDKSDLYEKIKISNPNSSLLNLDLSDESDLLIYEKLNFLFDSFNNNKQLKIDDYESLKTEISDYLGITKDQLLKEISIKEVKELKGIEYIKPRFLINDSFIFKKNAIKNSLYEKYRQSLYNERLINPYFGFCNYNSLNFASVLPENKNHSNIIIYENRSTGSNKNKYDFINQNAFCFQSRIIFRKSKDIEKPGCILHIPGIINVFTVKTPLQDTGRIVISLGEYTQKNIFYEYVNRGDVVDKNFININSLKIQQNNSTYISEPCLKENHWHTIFLQVDKVNKNISLFVDGNKFNDFKFDESLEKQNNNSYICLGNTINYFNNKTSLEVTNIDKCFHFIFNEITQENKFINLYEYEEELTEYHNIKDLIEEDFEINIKDNSFCFIGEISDIRFYRSKFYEKDINLFHLSYVNNIEAEELDFYVPVMYAPKIMGKKGIISGSGREENIAYSLYYNPYFSSSCGGLEINVESFLIEFKKNNIPNVIINGNNPDNFYFDQTAIGFKELLQKPDYTDLVSNSLKKGTSINDIYNELYKDYISKNNSNIITNNFGNLSLKNSFILPNDNGVPKVNFSILEKYILSNNAVEKNKLNNIKSDDVFLSHKEYLIKDYNTNYSIYNNLKDEAFYIMTYEGIFEKYVFTNDIFSDISNIIYYDRRFEKFEDLYNYLESNLTNELSPEILSVLNRVKEKFSLHEINTSSIFRINKSNTVYPLDIGSNILLKKVITFNDKDISYKPLNITSNNLNSDYDSFFISIIDIPDCFYNNKLEKDSINIELPFKINYLSNNFINLKDDGSSSLYRSDCLSKVAKWNYVGHIFYNEGLAIIHNPVFTNVDQDNFKITLSSETSINVKEINIPLDYGEKNVSSNITYDKELRIDNSAINFEESFVYITDINLHDDRFNLVSKTKLAKPIAKKDSDRFLIRVKSDF